MLAWIFQLIATAIALTMFPNSRYVSSWPISNVDAIAILAFGFASIFYTEIGLCIHKRFNIMPFAAWLVVTVIILFIQLLLYAFATFTYDHKGYELSHLLMTTPFYVITLNDHSLKITDLPCWITPFLAIVGLLFAFVPILEQYKSLRISSDK